MPHRLQLGLILFIVWLGLTNSLDPQELVAGLLVSAAVVWLAVPARPAGASDRSWRLLPLLAYLPVFLKNLFLSNIDVARRVLSPSLPINPGIVRVKTQLKEPYQRLILANSITLTPGTVTLEMEGEDMYVHWIDVKETDPERAGAAIKDEMEKAIARI
ncbi:Na+/H+ antiporter subunit E [Thiorhodococcus mannitoliphagus]|uniref:Na+/H+ antiporter subunit E n=1 Tax=Thiorhodococcus mannitoliphagus TaxID=329406 RepID=A0A6P1E0W7_9GAMM|nr:Na+/H+ antiporter subunit E [Thiorhodococcus mannitoliphagus]NEX22883.1 Na+/H+ antiporter subunit E [Thiorhodococcus mannitoliphagus]